MQKQQKSAQKKAAPAKTIVAAPVKQQNSIMPWLLFVVAITAVCLFPMLNNGFTNWDDEFYVHNNPLLRGPDLNGIFTQPVNDNYHPLTVLSLAVNFKLSELAPFSYLLVNFLLHLANTA